MPDFGAPVAANVQVPNVTQTLGGLMNLKLQQQHLQSGAIGIQQQEQDLQRGAATTQMTQQDAQQRAAIAKIDWSKYDDGTGTVSTDKMLSDQGLRQAAGDKFLDVVTHGAQMRGVQLENKQKLVQLNDGLRNQFGSMVGALRTDPDVIADNPAGRQKVTTAMTEFGQAGGPDAERVAQIYGQVATHAPQGQLARGISAIQLQAMDAGRQASAQQPTYADTGGQLTPTNPQAAGGNLGPTPALGKSLSPQVVTQTSGIPEVWGGARGAQGPAGGGAAAPPGAAGAGGAGGAPGGAHGPAPTTGDWANFNQYQSNLDARVRLASDSLPRIQQATQAMAQIKGGGGAPAFADFAKKLQAVPGMPESIVNAVAGGNLAAAQEAQKYLFQTTFQGLRQAMQGDPARVAEFQAAESNFPSIGTDPKATQHLLQFMSDQSRRDYAEQQALVKARGAGQFNPVTWQADYQQKLRAGQIPGVPVSQVPSGPPQGKTATQAEVDAYAKKHGLTPEAAKAHVQANGYTVQ